MRSNKFNIWFWLFISPVIIGLITVIIIPFITGIYYSFTDWNGILKPEFVGFDNFLFVFKDKVFMASLWFTIKYAIVAVILINAIGLGLALLVTQKLYTENLLRTVFFVPNLIGGLILGFIWQFIFLKIFPSIGIQNWLVDAFTGFWAIVIVATWQMAGYIMVIYIAYLQNIPSELLEAGDIDGANYFQKFKNIIFPLLAPGFTVCMFLTLANSFKMYDINLSLTAGGPGNQTRMLAMDIVNTAFSDSKMALGQSKAVIFFIIISVISLFQAYVNKKREVEM